ncbi:MAG: acyl-CoA dehydrogenase family protein [Gammaproteobacteria bacterium]|nr:acyl-CoA dehydrogenase family protein [Gammaproteobacteria bacterium]
MSDIDIPALRAELRAWLAAHWQVDQGLVAWREKLVESGWGMPHWPREWHGRGLPVACVSALEEEFEAMGAVGVARAGIRLLAAATLLEHGTDAHKQRFLRRILTGEDTWCQLFSEPGSGSDLAGATTRAEFDGTRWVVNGQKLWTTSAHHADWGLLLARTDWDAPKHTGLSFFVIDMHQGGVEVQPLKQMNGHASFNQVFLTDALVPAENQVGNTGDGWKIAMTTLAHERRNADALRRWGQGSGRAGRIYDEERAEIATVMEPYRWYPQRTGRVDLLLPRARATGRIADPALRQDLASVLMLSRASEWLAQRARHAKENGKPEGPEGSLGKLVASHVARAAARVHTAIGGMDAMLAGADGAEQGLVAEILLSVPATSIAGGTDEIQRNIIGERVLDLPREPRTDAGPFRDIPRNPPRGR